MSETDGDLWFLAKAHNRRVHLYYFEDDDMFVLRTKALVSFKRRLISQTATKFSPETFTILRDLIVMIGESPQYKSSINRALGRLQKHGAITIGTNFEEAINE